MIKESSTATETLVIENEAVCTGLAAPGATITWDITWIGISGENQYIYAEFFNDFACTGGSIVWNGDLEITGGQTVSLNSGDYFP